MPVHPPIDEDVTFDLDADEDEALKRYETMFRSLVANRICKPLDRRYGENDVGKNIQNSIIDWSVNHALQGQAYIDETQMNLHSPETGSSFNIPSYNRL
jgi:hypothetical protein